MQNVVIKKIDLKRSFAACICLSETQNPIPPLFIHCIRVYSVLIHTGKGGGWEELNQREG
jgi:hypothetical protein